MTRQATLLVIARAIYRPWQSKIKICAKHTSTIHYSLFTILYSLYQLRQFLHRRAGSTRPTDSIGSACTRDAGSTSPTDPIQAACTGRLMAAPAVGGFGAFSARHRKRFSRYRKRFSRYRKRFPDTGSVSPDT